MKNKLILFIILNLLQCLCYHSLYAQEVKPFKTTATVGLPLGFFDVANFGVQLGLNPSYRLSSRFTLEGQVAATYQTFSRDSDTFAHDGGSTFSVAALVGLRFYLAREEKNNRPYINFLTGYGYLKDEEYIGGNATLTAFKEDGLAYSMGFYLDLKEKFLLGLAAEGVSDDGMLVLKFGYTF